MKRKGEKKERGGREIEEEKYSKREGEREREKGRCIVGCEGVVHLGDLVLGSPW